MGKGETNPSAEQISPPKQRSSSLWTLVKFSVSVGFLYAAWNGSTATKGESEKKEVSSRRLDVIGDVVPSYMDSTMKDLVDRKKLFEETPPEEVKYWFEYTGPLQVSSIG